MNKNILNVEIDPVEQALVGIGASTEDFTLALDAALNRLADRPLNELPGPTDIPIRLRGKDRRLGEVATIRVTLRTPDHSRC